MYRSYGKSVRSVLFHSRIFYCTVPSTAKKGLKSEGERKREEVVLKYFSPCLFPFLFNMMPLLTFKKKKNQ